jgi:hypothetical protein
MSSFALPPRRDEQSLHGYVHEHLGQVERALRFGVPYRALVKAMLAAGFAKVPVRTVQNAVYQARKKRRAHALPPALQTRTVRSSLNPTVWAVARYAPEAQSGRAAIRARLLELARPPMPGEPDRLI